MKKLFGFLAALCVASLILLTISGCSGGDSKNELNLNGNWKIALNDRDITYQQTQIYGPIVDAMDGKLEFKSEGKVGSDSKSMEGSWSVEGDKVTIIDPTGALGSVGSVTFTHKDGKLYSDSQKYVCLVRV